MAETSLPRLTRIPGELLAASVQAPLPAYTKRRIFGPTGLTDKATAIVGMRRAGKTTFLHMPACPDIGVRAGGFSAQDPAWPLGIRPGDVQAT